MPVGRALANPVVHPLLLEINTRCWLRSLSDSGGENLTLANIPESEFAGWQKFGITHIWLMGVWRIGPRARAVSLAEPELQKRFRELLPKSGPADFTGSPYAIAGYQVFPGLGGETALRIFRERLNARGIKLVLDFIPNHVGLDHPWVFDCPELFVQSSADAPGTFTYATVTGVRRLAHGRDPYFPPWRDTAQLDYRLPETRVEMLAELQSVARRCDGVRCDLAMLLLNDVFEKTWDKFPTSAPAPESEFWADAIAAIRHERPDFLFLAEAYWDLEPRLQSLGFDYTYDKRVYDLLVERNIPALQTRLREAPPDALSKGAHFLENHDEPRIATLFPPGELPAAALLMMSLPGMRMLYEGQLQGRRLRVPVQLARWPDEPPDAEVQAMHGQLLTALKDSAVGRGDWKILEATNEPDGAVVRSVVAIQWTTPNPQFNLAVVNLGPADLRCRIELVAVNLSAHDWQVLDTIGGDLFSVAGRHLQAQGLHLYLPGHAAKLLRFSPGN